MFSFYSASIVSTPNAVILIISPFSITESGHTINFKSYIGTDIPAPINGIIFSFLHSLIKLSIYFLLLPISSISLIFIILYSPLLFLPYRSIHYNYTLSQHFWKARVYRIFNDVDLILLKHEEQAVNDSSLSCNVLLMPAILLSKLLSVNLFHINLWYILFLLHHPGICHIC